MAERSRRTTRPRTTSTPPPAGGEGLVIYIHGIGHQAPPEELKLEWDLALFGREMGDRTRLAYWSDLLHGPGRPRTVAVRTRSRSNQVRPGALLESAGVDPDDPDAMTLAHGLLRTAGVGTGDARTKALPLPAPLRKGIARAFLESFVKDTAAYFFRKKIRSDAKKRLREVLPSGEPCTLVAHSQGTIIALEVLSELRAASRIRIGQFVTIGSPLGIQEVQDFLSCKLEVPGVVEAWSNFADPLDPVALDKGLGDDFKPFRDSRSGREVRILDELVVNARSRRLQAFNPHSGAGYLANPKVRTVVYRAAHVDLHAKFLVARDVAADLAVDDRHSVLIEILEPGYRALGEEQEEMLAHESKVERGATDLVSRVANAAEKIEEIVGEGGKEALEKARVDPLRRFVSARLTPGEIGVVARLHKDLRVYAVWKSNSKRKLVHRSGRVIQADAAQTSYGAFGKGIRWAVLDTGVRSDHPHFAGNDTVAAIWDCTVRGRPKRLDKDRDRDGHGTHVAGIIAGMGKNAKGEPVQGIAPQTKLEIYRVLDDDGAGEDAWIIKALDHIAEQNENNSDILIHGLNLSLGGPYDASVYGCGFSPICVELRRLWRGGVLVCVASGNEGQTEISTPDGELELNTSMSIGDPANLEDSIAVGSVNADRPHLYGVSSFSSRGPTSDGRLKPDVVAPGERISSCNSRFRKGQPDSFYREESGTSMAAPHVSGLLAAFLSARLEFRGRPDEVKELLLRTCTDLGRDRYHQGFGVPNLMRMLLEA